MVIYLQEDLGTFKKVANGCCINKCAINSLFPTRGLDSILVNIDFLGHV